MIIKFFKHKEGGGAGAVRYLLNKRREEGTARVLRGNEKLTRNIINSITTKQKVCVGCLSFEEENITEEQKREIMDSFEDNLLLEMRERVNILWVEHTDKGRLELNFVIPKIDLETRRAFNPYYHKSDLKRVDLWKQIINQSYSLTDPNDPKKAQTYTKSKGKDFKDYEELDLILQKGVENGSINSRAELIAFLQGAEIEITRQGADYLSIKLPNSPKAKRFKGGIYAEQFRSPKELKREFGEARAREQEYHQRQDRGNVEGLKKELEKENRRRTEFIKQRYYRTDTRGAETTDTRIDREFSGSNSKSGGYADRGISEEQSGSQQEPQTERARDSQHQGRSEEPTNQDKTLDSPQPSRRNRYFWFNGSGFDEINIKNKDKDKDRSEEIQDDGIRRAYKQDRELSKAGAGITTKRGELSEANKRLTESQSNITARARKYTSPAGECQTPRELTERARELTTRAREVRAGKEELERELTKELARGIAIIIAERQSKQELTRRRAEELRGITKRAKELTAKIGKIREFGELSKTSRELARRSEELAKSQSGLAGNQSEFQSEVERIEPTLLPRVRNTEGIITYPLRIIDKTRGAIQSSGELDTKLRGLDRGLQAKITESINLREAQRREEERKKAEIEAQRREQEQKQQAQNVPQNSQDEWTTIKEEPRELRLRKKKSKDRDMGMG